MTDLPPDEQAEVRCAMAIFEAYAVLQSGLDGRPPSELLDRARADSTRFMRAWETEAIILGWPAEAIFAPPTAPSGSGLVYWLGGEPLRSFGPEHAVSESGRIFDRMAA